MMRPQESRKLTLVRIKLFKNELRPYLSMIICVILRILNKAILCQDQERTGAVPWVCLWQPRNKDDYQVWLRIKSKFLLVIQWLYNVSRWINSLFCLCCGGCINVPTNWADSDWVALFHHVADGAGSAEHNQSFSRSQHLRTYIIYVFCTSFH